MSFNTSSPLYSVWGSMRQRCSNPRAKQWADYGGRGIVICERWSSFAAFEADMSPRPPSTLLDRIDNDGPYSPENCRWATRLEQQRNQRRTIVVTIDGTSYKAIELSEQSGMKVDTIVKRAKDGLAFDEVMSPKRRPFRGGWQSAVRAHMANAAARTHCRKGHLLSGSNLYVTPERWKRCRECRRIYLAARRQLSI